MLSLQFLNNAKTCSRFIFQFASWLPLALWWPSSFAVVTPSLAAQPDTCVVPVDWTTLPSTYSHDQEGRPVDQFATGVEPSVVVRNDYQQSGFRHSRSTVQAGTSTDHYHVVERWGPPVQPYGEWRYPYRPFAVPYGAWGPQPPLVNVQSSFGNGFGNGFPNRLFPPGWSPWMGPGGLQGNNGQGSANQLGPGMVPGNLPWPYPPTGGFFPNPNDFRNGWQNGFGVGPGNALIPEQDDYYPAAPEPPPVSDRDFFFVPR
jgi:hypothetical protein